MNAFGGRHQAILRVQDTFRVLSTVEFYTELYHDVTIVFMISGINDCQ